MDHSAAIKAAEDEIKRILLALAEQTGLCVDQVDVDTRNFANYSTTIFLEGWL